jgi:predicted PilT family ATPase
MESIIQITVKIESQAMKHVIGRKGTNIERIRNETKTDIQTGAKVEAGKQNIRIMGIPENVATATEKISESANKLRICKEFTKGQCKNANTCKYAHVQTPLVE